ncbi:serine hydrolase domain-containing protein [Maricaulis sp.]|uniref:serine hydrolase domain-containing protein n=1 Tax=Maricaulis sp. TaxID=1486257 RepID=UPI0026186CE9|nr:serine hydrolase domain-containing protein [Maricaulis sp.]
MKRHLIAALAAVVLPLGAALAQDDTPLETPAAAAVPAEPAPTASGLDPDDIALFFDSAIVTNLAENDIPGVVVTVVQNGELVFAKGYGHADAAQTRPVDPATTLFRPGSVSKLLTWTAVTQLVEQGRLDLDSDVNAYLDGTGIEIPEAFGGPVTLAHILAHTGGFEDGAVGFLFADDVDDLRPLGDVMLEHQPARVRPAGYAASYSNWATSLAGVIVANVSGRDFETYIEENILGPLGMTQSSFREPLPDTIAADMSEGMMREAGETLDQGFEYIANFGPAGALSASGTDMARFMLAHLNGGELDGARILSAQTAERMHSQLYTMHPGLPGMAHGFFEQEYNGQRVISHGGDTLWFHSNLVLVPEHDLGIYISTNGAEGAALRGDVFEAFMDTFYPGEPIELLTPEADTDLSEYVGLYRYNRHAYTTLEKITAASGDLTVSASADGALLVTSQSGTRRYVALGDDVFRSYDSEARIAFMRDESGAVTHYLPWNAPIFAAYRISPMESLNTQLLVVGPALLIFLNLVAGTLVHWRRVFAMNGMQKLARLNVFALGATQLIFIGGLAMVLSSAGTEIVFGWPPALSTLLAFPVIGAALTLSGAVLAFRLWSRGDGSVLARLRYSTVILFSAGYLAVLNYWNLLGWKF